MKVKIKYDRDLLEILTELLHNHLGTALQVNDIGKILYSCLNHIRIQHGKALADPSKVAFNLTYPAHYAIALKIFLQSNLESKLVNMNSWEGNEFLKVIALIDQTYL